MPSEIRRKGLRGKDSLILFFTPLRIRPGNLVKPLMFRAPFLERQLIYTYPPPKVNPDPTLHPLGRSKSRTMRYEPSSLLLGRDEILRDKHQMVLQSCLAHGSITHLKCSYGLASQISVSVTTSGLGQDVAWSFLLDRG